MLNIILYLMLLGVVLSRIAGNQLKYGYSGIRTGDWKFQYQYWPTFSTGELPGKPSDRKLYFYQTLVNLVAPPDILYYRITLVFDGGFAMFVNGNEVYRQFLINNFKDSTLPSRTDLTGHQTIRILPYYFIDGLNLFSFEFHSQRASMSDPFEMVIDVETSANNCSENLNSPSMYFIESFGGENNYVFSNAFDGSKNTKYLQSNKLPTKFTMFFAEPYGFNKLVFVGADNCCARNPKMVKTYGITKCPDSYKFKNIFSQTEYINTYFDSEVRESTCPMPDEKTHPENAQYEVLPFNLENKRAFNGYNVEVTGTVREISINCNKGVQFSELEMYSCKISKCLGDNKLPEAFAGTKIVKPCPYGSTMINYTCLDTGIWKATGSCSCK